MALQVTFPATVTDTDGTESPGKQVTVRNTLATIILHVNVEDDLTSTVVASQSFSGQGHTDKPKWYESVLQGLKADVQAWVDKVRDEQGLLDADLKNLETDIASAVSISP